MPIEIFAKADKDYAARMQKALTKPGIEEPQMEHEAVGATSAPSERRPQKQTLLTAMENRSAERVALFFPCVSSWDPLAHTVSYAAELQAVSSTHGSQSV